MTKSAVMRTYQSFLERLTEELLDVVSEEFGGGLLGRAARGGAKQVTKKINREMQTQGRVVVEYAAALANGDPDPGRFHDRFLQTNPVYKRYDGPAEDALESDLLDHFERAATDLAPLVASETDDFWTAMTEEYERAEARALVERHFAQAEHFKQYRDGVFASARLGERIIDIVDRGETRLREQLLAELDRAYEP